MNNFWRLILSLVAIVFIIAGAFLATGGYVEPLEEIAPEGDYGTGCCLTGFFISVIST